MIDSGTCLKKVDTRRRAQMWGYCAAAFPGDSAGVAHDAVTVLLGVPPGASPTWSVGGTRQGVVVRQGVQAAAFRADLAELPLGCAMACRVVVGPALNAVVARAGMAVLGHTLREALRVLHVGGCLEVTMAGTGTFPDVAVAYGRAVGRLRRTMGPGVPAAPFGLVALDELVAACRWAGGQVRTAHTRYAEAVYPDAAAVVAQLRVELGAVAADACRRPGALWAEVERELGRMARRRPLLIERYTHTLVAATLRDARS